VADHVATILVVDDEPEMRDVICSDLQERGLKTVEAEDGEAALKVLRREPIDVVISDLSMPAFEGMALLAQMRQEDLWQPFIILTGYGSKDASVTALRLGAFDFLEKPVDFERLAGIVNDALTAQAAHKEMLAVLQNKLGAPQDIASQRKIESLARMFAARSTIKKEDKSS
jgi:DNA-binding NtrC family response regulator